MPVNLSGADALSASFLVIGSAVFLLVCVLTYLAALCYYTVNNASVSLLKDLSDDTPAVERAIAVKNADTAYSGRLKACMTCHAAAAVWLAVALYWQPFARLFYHALQDTIWSLVLSGIVLGVLLLTVLLAVVYFVPMRAAAVAPEKRLVRLHGLMTVWGRLFLPLTLLGKGLSAVVCRLFLHEEKQEPPAENPTEEKILKMVDEGEVNGTIEGNTKSLI